MKMSKFRVWLIRKLGGEILSPVQPPKVIEVKKPTVILESKVSITDENIRAWQYMFGEKGENKVKKMLWDGLFDEAKDLIEVRCTKNIELMTTEFKCRLTIVKETTGGKV